MNVSETAQPASARDDPYRRARRRVHQLRGFYRNLFMYVVIVAFLAVLNLLTDHSYVWVAWVALGWGLAIAFQAYSVFVTHGPLGNNWEQRKIRELMEREQRPGAADINQQR